MKAFTAEYIEHASGPVNYTQTVTDAVGVTDNTATANTFIDAVGITDASPQVTTSIRSITDPVGVTEVVVVSPIQITITDPVGITEVVTPYEVTVVVYNRSRNGTNPGGAIAKIDGTRFLHVFTEWNGANGVIFARIGTVDANAMQITFGAENNLGNLPNYTGTGQIGRPPNITLACASTTLGMIQWTDGYRSYWFTPLTMNVGTGVVTAGSTVNTFGVGTSFSEASVPRNFCAYDATHFAAFFNKGGTPYFGVMDATATVVGTPVDCHTGTTNDVKTVIAMDTARTQFLTFNIVYDIGAYDPYIQMVTPGSPPVLNNSGVIGTNVQDTNLARFDDTHAVYGRRVGSHQYGITTATTNGGTFAITEVDGLTWNQPSQAYTDQFSTPQVVYPLRHEIIGIDATHVVVSAELFYPPTPSDDNFGMEIMRAVFWTLECDGNGTWAIVCSTTRDLDASSIIQQQVEGIYSLGMNGSACVTLFNQFNQGAGTPHRIVLYTPTVFNAFAPIYTENENITDSSTQAAVYTQTFTDPVGAVDAHNQDLVRPLAADAIGITDVLELSTSLVGVGTMACTATATKAAVPQLVAVGTATATALRTTFGTAAPIGVGLQTTIGSATTLGNGYPMDGSILVPVGGSVDSVVLTDIRDIVTLPTSGADSAVVTESRTRAVVLV